MRALFLLFGLALGLWASFGRTIEPIIATSIVFVFVLFLSFQRKQAPIFLLAFAFRIGKANKAKTNPNGKGSYQGVVVKCSDNSFLLLVGLRRHYVYASNHPYEVGDILKINGYARAFTTTTYESRFDYGEYLRSYGTNREISANQIDVVFSTFFRIRSWENRFLSHYEGNVRGLLSSLLFGRSDYDSISYRISSSLNLFSLVSSSGLLAGTAIRIIEKISSFWMKKDSSSWVGVIASTLLLLFHPFSIGIQRVVLGKWLYKFFPKWDPLTRMGCSGAILILLSRYNAYQNSFLLGYGLSLILRFTSPSLQKLKRFKKAAVRILLVSTFLFPAALSSENGYHPFSILLVQILSPFFAIAMIIGGFCYLFYPFKQPLNAYSTFLLKILIGLEKIDISLPFPPLSPIWGVAIPLGIIFFFYLKEKGFSWHQKALTTAFLVAYAFQITPISIPFTSQISFINVGQGDAILIRDRTSTVLLDTGGNIRFDMAKETLIPFFRKQKIHHIDCLIASHHDYDHIGAKDSLMSSFPVNRFVDSIDSFPLKIGGLELMNYNTFDAKEENDKSLFISLRLMGKDWLFTGDAPVWVEKAVIQHNPSLRCDVLKVGHHGSDTSTCDEFLDAVSPDVAIISCGAKNSYGHPSPKVVERLQKRGIKIRRTDKEGTITYRAIRV